MIKKFALFALTLLFPFAAFAAEPMTKVHRPLFTVCADTHDAKKRSIDEQHVLLAELGFDGMMHLGLKDLLQRVESAKKHGLKVFCVHYQFNLGEPVAPNFKESLACLKDSGTFLSVAIKGGKPSDASLDDKAVKTLREMLEIAEPLGIKIVLYPHKNFWNETVDDSIRLAKHFDGKIGVMFNLCHWAADAKGGKLETALKSVKPYLSAITISGSDTPEEIQTKKGNWIQPLDAGSYNLSELFRILDDIGYTGPVGLHCWNIQGDAKLHLERSMKKWKEMNGITADKPAEHYVTKIRRPLYTLLYDKMPDVKKRPMDEQHALLAEFGFDGIMQVWLKDKNLPERIESAKKHGLKSFCVHHQFNLNKPIEPELKEILTRLKAQENITFLSASIEGGKPSDVSLDDKAVKMLQDLLEITEPLGIKIVLYPHWTFWNLTLEDSVRIAKRFDGKIGVIFNLCHWTVADKNEDLAAILKQAKPYLSLISICGTDTLKEVQAAKDHGTKVRKGIQPLDAGSFDVSELFRILDDIGYAGPVALQCFNIEGDARAFLDRSMKKWKSINGIE